mmetsp:Transcript_35732/g.114319  ORF Transcript_35732/g.114319 Transcript_35732/m.114319 type:complete len:383 (-) Transcript_35732:681-1829(-)
MRTLALTGDVMVARGIDQAFSVSCPPAIAESYMKDARGYIAIAEEANGRFRRPIEDVWGDALGEIRKRKPAKVIVNLETAVTTSDDLTPKGINYRVHPENAVKILGPFADCAVLANNHVLDWGRGGLEETLQTLTEAGIPFVGAGTDVGDAAKVKELKTDDDSESSVWIAAYGHESSGVPKSWQATPDRPGVNTLPDLDPATATRIGRQLVAASSSSSKKKQQRDPPLRIVSLHWGPNWGYTPTRAERAFAHALVDAGVDIVYGHSSHHPRPVEVYRQKLILYGCGDFINDYEGILSHRDKFRDDLVLAYVPTFYSSETEDPGKKKGPRFLGDAPLSHQALPPPKSHPRRGGLARGDPHPRRVHTGHRPPLQRRGRRVSTVA